MPLGSQTARPSNEVRKAAEQSVRAPSVKLDMMPTLRRKREADSSVYEAAADRNQQAIGPSRWKDSIEALTRVPAGRARSAFTLDVHARSTKEYKVGRVRYREGDGALGKL